ncbi:MAG: RidA family protein [Halomonas subglaciescola]|nr:RidA family protein [Halomonas subglaciescola]
MSLTYHDSNERMSKYVIHNGTVYLAGQVPYDGEADMRGQTEQVLERIDELLARAGTDKSHLIAAQIWVADRNDAEGMNQAWDAWVVPGRPPIRAAIEAQMLNPLWKVEIMVTAALPEA